MASSILSRTASFFRQGKRHEEQPHPSEGSEYDAGEQPGEQASKGQRRLRFQDWVLDYTFQTLLPQPKRPTPAQDADRIDPYLNPELSMASRVKRMFQLRDRDAPGQRPATANPSGPGFVPPPLPPQPPVPPSDASQAGPLAAALQRSADGRGLTIFGPIDGPGGPGGDGPAAEPGFVPPPLPAPFLPRGASADTLAGTLPRSPDRDTFTESRPTTADPGMPVRRRVGFAEEVRERALDVYSREPSGDSVTDLRGETPPPRPPNRSRYLDNEEVALLLDMLACPSPLPPLVTATTLAHPLAAHNATLRLWLLVGARFFRADQGYLVAPARPPLLRFYHDRRNIARRAKLAACCSERLHEFLVLAVLPPETLRDPQALDRAWREVRDFLLALAGKLDWDASTCGARHPAFSLCGGLACGQKLWAGAITLTAEMDGRMGLAEGCGREGWDLVDDDQLVRTWLDSIHVNCSA